MDASASGPCGPVIELKCKFAKMTFSIRTRGVEVAASDIQQVVKGRARHVAAARGQVADGLPLAGRRVALLDGRQRGLPAAVAACGCLQENNLSGKILRKHFVDFIN